MKGQPVLGIQDLTAACLLGLLWYSRLLVALDSLQEGINEGLNNRLPVLSDKGDKIVCGRSVTLDRTSDSSCILSSLLGSDSVDVFDGNSVA